LRALIPDSRSSQQAARSVRTSWATSSATARCCKHPETQKLAKDNAKMIEEYRDDVESLRRGVTRAARSIPGSAIDLYDHIRGPLQPGEPARREAEKNGHHTSMLRMDDANHGQPTVQRRDPWRARAGRPVGRVPDVMSTQLAGSLAAEMHAAAASASTRWS
jgi:hypothetical protein